MKRGKGRSVFGTDKRIRLGIWGLGRGLNFYKACAALNIDVVAGCDYNEHMRKRFLEENPGALVTEDADTFLSWDFDAVLLATFCPAHAPDALRCLDAGKHVLSEVTAFHTMAEGVQLVEAVQKSGLVYNLAENYPFTAEQMYVARRWREGLFGELMYAEGEYVHEVRTLAYTYIDGTPVQPGWTLHNWRSWLNFHYYCTHSLGPIMHITGTRPVQVVTLPAQHTLPGYPPGKSLGLGGIAPSLIRMDNGAVVKNLMGGTTNDTHLFRYWGTKGSAEIGHGLWLRLGGGGSTPKLEVKAGWGEFTPLAAEMGHGGGDFFVLYFFARQILLGTPAPWDIFSAADVTIPGILACRSAEQGGAPYDVPDFRKKADRDRCRHDTMAQPRYDVEKGCFPRAADTRKTAHFNRIMRDLINGALVYHTYTDWRRVAEDMKDPAHLEGFAARLIDELPRLRKTATEARRLAKEYPHGDGARMMRDALDFACAEEVLRPALLTELKKEHAALKRRLRRKIGPSRRP